MYKPFAVASLWTKMVKMITMDGVGLDLHPTWTLLRNTSDRGGPINFNTTSTLDQRQPYLRGMI